MANGRKKSVADVKKVAADAEKKVHQAMAKAENEVKKVKNEMDKSIKKVEAFVKKNPEKASLISAGIGAALGASLALLLKKKKGKK